jgi:predicted cobalt transporter CbtA
MMKFGLRGLLLLLAVVLFIVGALSDEGNTRQDLLYWGLAVFAASFIVESIPLGNMMAGRTRER